MEIPTSCSSLPLPPPEIRTDNFPAFGRENRVFFFRSLRWGLGEMVATSDSQDCKQLFSLTLLSTALTLLWEKSTTIDGRILHQLRLAVHPTYWVFYIPLTTEGCLSSRVEEAKSVRKEVATESFLSVPIQLRVKNLRSHSMKSMANTIFHCGFQKMRIQQGSLSSPCRIEQITCKQIRCNSFPSPCKMKIIFESARWDGIC